MSIVLLTIVIAAAIAAGWWLGSRGPNWPLVFLACPLIYAVSWFGWLNLNYFQTVPVDSLMARFGIYPAESDPLVGRLLLLLPPLMPVAIFLLVTRLARSRAHRFGREAGTRR